MLLALGLFAIDAATAQQFTPSSRYAQHVTAIRLNVFL